MNTEEVEGFLNWQYQNWAVRETHKGWEENESLKQANKDVAEDSNISELTEPPQAPIMVNGIRDVNDLDDADEQIGESHAEEENVLHEMEQEVLPSAEVFELATSDHTQDETQTPLELFDTEIHRMS